MATVSFSGLFEGIPLGWALIGLLGQLIFASRFILQWIVSERVQRSVIPAAFWYMSIIGSLLVLAYALRRWDPIFILAYAFNTLVYFRNVMLLYRRGGSMSPFGVDQAP